jgi:tyrosine-protein kinase Etk/Wzc
MTPTTATHPGDGGDDFDFKEFVRLLLKQRRLIARVTGAGAVLALLYLLLAPPVYEAQVTVKVPDSRGGGVLKDLAMLSSSTDPMETYLEVARSINVATRAAAKVNLRTQPGYTDFSDDEEAVAELRGRVSVVTFKLSNLMVMKAQAGTPQLAAQLADAWAAGFIDANIDFSRTGAHNKRQFIEEQLTSVKERLLQGEEVLRRLAERQKSVGGLSRETSPDRDPVISLKTQVLNLEVEKATLASRYGPDHPAMRSIDARLAEARAQLNQGMANLPKNEMDYLRLSRDVKVDEAVYNMLLERGQEARIAENVDDSGIVVVDKAQVPRKRLSPRRGRVLLVSLLLSALAGLGAAWLLERQQDQIGGEDDLKRLTGLPVLGLVPDWRAEGAPAPAAGSAAPRHDPSYLINAAHFEHSFYAESFKSLRTNLNFTDLGSGLKALGVLSPNREEGKTLANANLALALALAGKRVCLVDADLRKPSVHKAFGLKAGAGKGLPLLLSGQGSPASMIVRGPAKGLSLLPCGVRAPNPAELMGSPRLPRLVEWLKARYDFVVFDAAPLLPVTDTLSLAACLDGLLLLARFEQTRRGELRRALEQLGGVRARVLGTVLNAVDMAKYAYTYGYGKRNYSYGDKTPRP